MTRKQEPDRDPDSPIAEQRIEGHLIRKLPKADGVAPPRVEFFSEDSPDGFPGDEPRFVAFCPDCGAKLTLEQHEECPFFEGRETGKDGYVVAIHCDRRPKPKKPDA